MSELLISNVVKVYPNMIQITIYHNSYSLNNSNLPHKRKLSSEQKNQINIDRSVRRTQTMINDLILCNNFDLWCTFTFSPKKIDRYNDAAVRSAMSMWLHRQSLHSPSFEYLIVPERHKDGAIHFHALVSGFNGRLKDSKRKTSRGQAIYNMTGFRKGFTEAVKLMPKDGDMSALANYIGKYITKDTPKIYGERRYWCSQGLKRPEKYVNGVSRFNLWEVVKTSPVHFITGEYEQYRLPYFSRFKDLKNQTQLLNVEDFTIPDSPMSRIDPLLLKH